MCTVVHMMVVDNHSAEVLQSIDEFACAVAAWEQQAAALALTARQLEVAGAFGYWAVPRRGLRGTTNWVVLPNERIDSS